MQTVPVADSRLSLLGMKHHAAGVDRGRLGCHPTRGFRTPRRGSRAAT